MISVKSRGKPAFSDEDNESEGEVKQEPQLPSHSRSAASVASSYRPASSWPKDLTGSVTPANMLHWPSSQDRRKSTAARRLSPPTGAPPVYAGADQPAPNSPNPPSLASAKRANDPSPLKSSKKARQDDLTAPGDVTPDRDDDLY